MKLKEKSDPQRVYFMNSSLNFYTFGLLEILFIYFIVKFVHLILYLLAMQWKIFTKVYKKFKYETMWWTLFVAVLEANINDIVFNCAIQIRLPSNFNFINKLNLSFNFIALFIMLAYSLCFYIIIFSFFKKHSSRVLLQRCKQEYSISFLFESMYILFRVFLRTLANGFFIVNYQYQIGLFVFVDVLNLILTFKIRDYFRNKLVFAFCFGYSLSITIFDSYLAAEALQNDYF